MKSRSNITSKDYNISDDETLVFDIPSKKFYQFNVIRIKYEKWVREQIENCLKWNGWFWERVLRKFWWIGNRWKYIQIMLNWY